MNLMQRMNLLIKKNKKIVRDIIDPTPGLFIDDKLNPNEQNLQNKTDDVFNLSHQVQQQLNEIALKKSYKTTNNSTNSTRNYSKHCSKN